MIIQGRCNKGESCNFAHNQNELRKPFDLTKTEICKNFLKGQCKFATNCKYAHGQQELRAKPIVYTSIMKHAYNKGYSNTSGRNPGEYHQNIMKRNQNQMVSNFMGGMHSQNRNSMYKLNPLNDYSKHKFKQPEDHYYFTTSYEIKANEAIKFAQELIQKEGIESWVFNEEWLYEDSSDMERESNQNNDQNPPFILEHSFPFETSKDPDKPNDEANEEGQEKSKE